MKNLSDYIKESLIITESFKSNILKEYLTPSLSKSKYHSPYELQWDKITDNKIHEVSYEEVLKLRRKRNESYYILWIGKEPVSMWSDDKRVDRVMLITWGNDVVRNFASRPSFRRETISQLLGVNHIFKAYWIEDPTDFLSGPMQRERREMKDGALFFKTQNQIKEENMKRYKAALQKMHTGDIEEIKSIFEKTMSIYNSAWDNCIMRFQAMLETNSPSTFDIKEKCIKLNKMMSSFLEDIQTYKSFHDGNEFANDHTAISVTKRAYDDIKSMSDALIKKCNELFVQNQE